jgi:hypothetical protein
VSLSPLLSLLLLLVLLLLLLLLLLGGLRSGKEAATAEMALAAEAPT